MENILVYDNFLNSDELNKAKEIIESKRWSWGHKSLDEINTTPFWTMDLSNIDFFSIYLKEVIEKHFGKKFKLLRVYANGQSFGQDGNYHTDSSDDNTYTFVLYLSHIEKKFIDTAGGYIYFKIPGKNYNICFEPIYNRSIFFPSKYIHKGTAFSRYVMDLRICVSWKLKEIV